MNAAAEAVMKELPDLVLAYGNSDEYRYVKDSPVENRMLTASHSKPLVSVSN